MDKVSKAVIDLDGEWPEEYADGHVLVRAWRDDLEDFKYYSWYPGWSWGAPAKTICTHPEFMEARARLENKPTEWPEWVSWTAQTSEGVWFGFEREPHHSEHAWRWSGRVISMGEGHIFGRWQDTLERRSPSTNNEHRDHKEGEGVEWEPGVDLPPVMTANSEAELIGFGRKDPTFVVVAHHYNGVTAVVAITTEGGVDYRPAKAAHFKARKSYRDKVIEAAETECGGIVDTGAVIRHLYEIGMLVYPGDPQ